jgi:chromosome segregation ATPase
MKDIEKLNTLLERTRTRLQEYRAEVEGQLDSVQNAIQEISQTLPKVEMDITGVTSQIKDNQETIADLSNKIQEIERLNLLRQEEISTIQTQLDELKVQSESLEERIAESEERLKSINSSLRDFQTDLEDVSNQIIRIERDIVEARDGGERAVSAKNLERDETEQELETLRQENAVADFLLEAIGDSEHLRFIAMLIHKSDLTVSELCEASRTSPEAASEIIKTLEEEGWIKLRGNNTIRFLKPL